MISFFNIRERKYEIGVLRAIGMKKSSVAKGMVYETLIIMFISFALSVLLGLELTKTIAAALLGDLTEINTTLPPMAIIFSAVMAFLFNILAGLDLCSSGIICCENQDIAMINRDEYRSKKVGVVFQSYNLLQNFCFKTQQRPRKLSRFF